MYGKNQICSWEWHHSLLHAHHRQGNRKCVFAIHSWRLEHGPGGFITPIIGPCILVIFSFHLLSNFPQTSAYFFLNVELLLALNILRTMCVHNIKSISRFFLISRGEKGKKHRHDHCMLSELHCRVVLAVLCSICLWILCFPSLCVSKTHFKLLSASTCLSQLPKYVE